MKRKELWKLSVLNVLSTPLRSALTIIGFAVGVAAILAVLTLGDAGKKEVVKEMGRLGIDKIWVSAEEENGLWSGMGQQLEQLTASSAVEHIYMYTQVMTMDGNAAFAAVAGMQSKELMENNLLDGRFPSAQEWEKNGCTALVGESLAGELNVHPGGLITVFGKIYQVCGIVGAAKNVTTVPIENALILSLDEMAAWNGGRISEIRMTAPENVSIGLAEKLISRALAWQDVQAVVTTMELQMEAAAGVTDTFVNVLKWVAFVCILVGGIGVMNILLVGVRERRREIGMMKSLGTTPAQICTLFLLEALVYAVFGGALGLALGMLLIRIAGYSIQLPASASAGDCAAVFAAAVTIGLSFGVLPALKASMLDCVDALRQE